MKTYRSPYPNYVHLMHVVASKHLYFLADGRLKHQDKTIESDLANVAESLKNVLVHMVITDHTSGAMYGESYSCRDTLDPVGFLRRAWNQKEHSFFCGVPELLSIAKTTETIWPEIRTYATRQGAQVVNPTSGFHGGAKHPVHWEKELSAWGLFSDRPEHQDFASLVRDRQAHCNDINPERRRRWFTEVPSRPPTRYPKD